MFEPARAYASRHRCVLLPFRALLAAMTESEIKHVER
jgi:NifU-like protein involved in Fe-S cluster formation